MNGAKTESQTHMAFFPCGHHRASIHLLLTCEFRSHHQNHSSVHEDLPCPILAQIGPGNPLKE